MTRLSGNMVSVIGSGNVAGYMAVALYNSGYNIKVIYSRNPENARSLAEKVDAGWTTEFNESVFESDITLFALTDKATEDFIGRIGYTDSFLLHTAGSLPMKIFAGRSPSFGVLYPFQTISANRKIEFDRIPLCIEANSPESLRSLRSIAESVSKNIYEIDSPQRIYLHMAAVFACNFTNHMYCLANKISESVNLPFDIFSPLITETAEKAIEDGPVTSQTGPAVRGDNVTIKKHLKLLESSPQLKEVYKLISNSISSYSITRSENKKKMDDRSLFPGMDINDVKCFVFDVDGVFTDGTVWVGYGDEFQRGVNIKDGFAVQLAVKKGYKVAIISGGKSSAVRKRFKGLGVNDIYLESSDKLSDLQNFCSRYNIDPSNILYIGDDLPDYKVMRSVGFPACPNDAVQEIKDVSGYISDYSGGKGCVRDIVEKVLRIHCNWADPDNDCYG